MINSKRPVDIYEAECDDCGTEIEFTVVIQEEYCGDDSVRKALESRGWRLGTPASEDECLCPTCK